MLSHGTRKQRISVHAIPEHSLDGRLRSPNPEWPLETQAELGRGSGILHDPCLRKRGDIGDVMSKNAIIGEVSDWLDFSEHDGHWGSHVWRQDQTTASHNNLTTPLIALPIADIGLSKLENPEAFTAFVRFIAIQLLASCYTCVAPSSASNLPFYQQRMGPSFVTSLHLHSRYRYFPAAGHHARETSEASSWPGLYTGPSIEERLAETISQRRRLEKNGKNQRRTYKDTTPRIFPSPMCDKGSKSLQDRYIESTMPLGMALGRGADRRTPSNTNFRTVDWTDGPAEAEATGETTVEADIPSSENNSIHLLQRWCCHEHLPCRLFSRYVYPAHKYHPDEHSRPRPSASSRHGPAVANTVSRSAQSIPKGILRRGESVPETYMFSTLPDSNKLDTRRNSSAPTISSLYTQDFDIPELDRVSVPTEGQSSPAYIRREPVTAKELLNKSELGLSGPVSHMNSPDTPVSDSTIRQEAYFTKAPLVPRVKVDSHDQNEGIVQDTPKIFSPAMLGPTVSESIPNNEDEDESWPEDNVNWQYRKRTINFGPVEFGRGFHMKLQRESKDEDDDSVIQGKYKADGSLSMMQDDSSDISIDMGGKRLTTVFRPVEFSQGANEKLQRQRSWGVMPQEE